MYLIGRLLTGSVNLVVDTTLHTPYTPKGAVSHRMAFAPDPGSRHLAMANIYSYSYSYSFNRIIEEARVQGCEGSSYFILFREMSLSLG